MLTFSVALSMATQQVCYTTAFCQAELSKPVYMEMSMGFGKTGYICEHLWTQGCSQVLVQ